MILLTGGTGFIGSHVATELLFSDHDVVIVDNFSNSSPVVANRISEITGKSPFLLNGDIRNQSFLDEVFSRFPLINSVIHFAGLKAVGESTKQPLQYFDNNVTGSINILKSMEKAGVFRFIFSSSATVYDAGSRVPFNEDSRTLAGSPYGQTKLIIENILEEANKADPRWKIAILRYFNPIGAHPSGLIGEAPKGPPNNLFPFILNVATRKSPKLLIFGDDYPTRDGTGMRDYIHVVDLASGHVKALDYLSQKELPHSPVIFNLGRGEAISVLDLVKAFETTNNVSIPYEITSKRPGDLPITFACPDRARIDLGWSASLGITDMCRDGWLWATKNPEGYPTD
jgi:UDP-glucose 4-epimerase